MTQDHIAIAMLIIVFGYGLLALNIKGLTREVVNKLVAVSCGRGLGK